MWSVPLGLSYVDNYELHPADNGPCMTWSRLSEVEERKKKWKATRKTRDKI